MAIYFRNVTVPNGNGKSNWSPDARKRFTNRISTILATGINVRFVDGDGDPAEVEEFHLSADGTVKTTNIDEATTQAKPYPLLGGGWHKHRAHQVYHNGTTAAIDIDVRMHQ